jgi:hypothetical protein
VGPPLGYLSSRKVREEFLDGRGVTDQRVANFNQVGSCASRDELVKEREDGSMKLFTGHYEMFRLGRHAAQELPG